MSDNKELLRLLAELKLPRILSNSYELTEKLLELSKYFTFVFRYETIALENTNITPLNINQIPKYIDEFSTEFILSKKLKDPALRKVFRDRNCAYALSFSSDAMLWLGINADLKDTIEHKIEFELFYYKLRSAYLSIAAARQLEKMNLEHKILSDVQLKLSASLDSETVLNAILDGLEKLVGYDAAGIFISTEGNEKIERVITRGYEDSKLNMFQEKKIHGVSSSIYTEKKPVIIGDVDDDPRYFKAREKTRSQISVPMFKGSDVIGVFTLEKDHAHFYTEDIIPFLQTFSEQAIIALHNAKLYQDSLHKQTLEKDMLDAAAIQQAILIKRAPKFANVDFSMLYRANRYVGGDIYDIIRLSEDSFYMNIGDVSGKGAPAAILMAVLFAGLRSQLTSRYQVCEHVAHLNNLLSKSTHPSSYATYFLASYNGEKQILTYSNAGHTPPALVRASGEVEYLAIGGMVIGFLENQIYRQAEINIGKGDVLIAFTDGLDEAFDANDIEFGVERIIDVVKNKRALSAKAIKLAVLNAVEDYHGAELDDDLTIIVAKF